MDHIPSEIGNSIISNLEPGTDVALSLVNRCCNLLLVHYRHDREKIGGCLHKMESKGNHAREFTNSACLVSLRLKPREDSKHQEISRQSIIADGGLAALSIASSVLEEFQSWKERHANTSHTCMKLDMMF